MSLQQSCDKLAKFIGLPVVLQGEVDRYSSYAVALVENASGIEILRLEFRREDGFGSWKLTDAYVIVERRQTLSQVFDQVKVSE